MKIDYDRINERLSVAGYLVRSGMANHLYYVTNSQNQSFAFRQTEEGWVCAPINNYDQAQAEEILALVMAEEEEGIVTESLGIDPVILDVIALHVFATEFLAQCLSGLTDKALAEWLKLAYTHGYTRARDSTEDEVKQALTRAMQAGGVTHEHN